MSLSSELLAAVFLLTNGQNYALFRTLQGVVNLFFGGGEARIKFLIYRRYRMTLSNISLNSGNYTSHSNNCMKLLVKFKVG